MRKGAPSLEEFTELVKNEYLDPEWVVDEKDAMIYFNGEEAQNHIKTEYRSAMKKYENGKLGVEGFREGYASRVAYCLYMMYE